MTKFNCDVTAEEARARFQCLTDKHPRFAPTSANELWDSQADVIRYLQTKIATIISASTTFIVKIGIGNKAEFKLMSKDAVLILLSGMHFMYKTDTPEGETTAFYHGEHYLKDNNRTWFNKIVFDPTDRGCENEENYGCFNTYNGMEFEPNDLFEVIPSRVQPFLDHLKFIMSNGNETMGSFLLDWCAHIIQHPGTKPESCCLFLSVQGTGKGIFWNIFSKLLGEKLVVTVNSKHRLTGNFNNHLADKLLVLVDEVMFGGEHAVNNQIKNMITDKTMVVERKGIDSMSRRSCERYVFMSNEDWPLRVEASDRRSACFEVSDERVGDRAYFEQLTRHFEERINLENVFQMLRKHRPNGNPVAMFLLPPNSALKEQLKAMARDDYVSFLKDLIANENGCDWMTAPAENMIITSDSLMSMFESWSSRNGKNSQKASVTIMGRTLSKILGKRVSVRIPGQVTHNGYCMSREKIKIY
jgi:Family of unknown function (DUF5906)